MSGQVELHSRKCEKQAQNKRKHLNLMNQSSKILSVLPNTNSNVVLIRWQITFCRALQHVKLLPDWKSRGQKDPERLSLISPATWRIPPHFHLLSVQEICLQSPVLAHVPLWRTKQNVSPLSCKLWNPAGYKHSCDCSLWIHYNQN